MLRAPPLRLPGEKLLAPPQDAVERRKCPGMRRAEVLKMSDPIYPADNGRDRPQGYTMVDMTVLPNGSVSDIQVIGGNLAMNDATVATLKKWKFKPAMCGAEPEVSDVRMVVTFNSEHF